MLGRAGATGRWDGLAVGPEGREDGAAGVDGREEGLAVDGRDGAPELDGRELAGWPVLGREGAVLCPRLGPLSLLFRDPPLLRELLALRVLDEPRLALRDPLLPRLPPREALRDPPDRDSARSSTGAASGASAWAGPAWNQASRVRVVSIGPPGSVGSALTAWTPQGGVVFDQSGSIVAIDRPGWP